MPTTPTGELEQALYVLCGKRGLHASLDCHQERLRPGGSLQEPREHRFDTRVRTQSSPPDGAAVQSGHDGLRYARESIEGTPIAGQGCECLGRSRGRQAAGNRELALELLRLFVCEQTGREHLPSLRLAERQPVPWLPYLQFRAPTREGGSPVRDATKSLEVARPEHLVVKTVEDELVAHG